MNDNAVKIALGCTASFGNPEDYSLDYDGCAIKNGLEILISPDTKKRNFEFAVAWIANINEKTKSKLG